jgi:hypothetical protein
LDNPATPCSVSALANISAADDPEFARCLMQASHNQKPIIHNLRKLSAWLRGARDCFPNHPILPYTLVHCLPRELDRLSLRDPKNQKNPEVWMRDAAERLEWVLQQTTGDYIAVIVASDNQANHVISVSAHRGLIFDHEVRMTLPFSRAGFSGTCGDATTCVGLGEVRRVVRSQRRKRPASEAFEVTI